MFPVHVHPQELLTCVHIIVHKCHIQHNKEQFQQFSPFSLPMNIIVETLSIGGEGAHVQNRTITEK